MIGYSCMSNFIRLNDALDEMNKKIDGKRVSFSLTFCTFDEKRKTGGRLKSVAGYVRCGLSYDNKKTSMIGIKKANDKGKTISVHTWLITKFNGVEVIL